MADVEHCNTTGDLIRSVRGILTQAEFARRLGVSTSTVARWEGDETRPSPLALRRIVRLAKRLGVPDNVSVNISSELRRMSAPGGRRMG